MKRTCTFQSILFAVATGRGMRPRAEGIPVDVAETLAEGITEAYDYAVKFRDWPEALNLEPLTVEVDGASGLAYLPRRLQSGVVLHTVHGIWTKHPEDKAAVAVPYRLQPLGYYLHQHEAVAGAQVWVKYRPESPKFSTQEFDITEPCLAGEVRYDADSGHCYLAVQDVTGQPVSNAAYWTAQPLLDVLRFSVIAGATAHYLRSEEQDVTARGYESKQVQRLEDEALRILQDEQQHDTYRTA